VSSGGPRKTIPNLVPQFGPDELARLEECVKSTWVSTSAPGVATFEAKLAAFLGVDASVATASGTAAIHAGLLSLGVGPGDVVLCPALTFIASINPVRYCGASPVLIGIETETLGMDPNALADFFEHHTHTRDGVVCFKATGQRVAAVILAHLYGRVADAAAVVSICAARAVPVLEDAAESLAARRDGALAGTFGDVGCFSFNANKLITCGSGGLVIARDPHRVRRCAHLVTQARSEAFSGRHDAVGYNYRMNGLCAAVGLAQFERLSRFLAQKRAIWARYRQLFSGTAFAVTEPSASEEPTQWMTVVRKGVASPEWVEQLRQVDARGIGVRPLWQPIRNHVPFADAPYFGAGSELQCLHSMVCLPSSVTLTEADQHEVVAALARLG
jgi:perosamine synthetase